MAKRPPHPCSAARYLHPLGTSVSSSVEGVKPAVLCPRNVTKSTMLFGSLRMDGIHEHLCPSSEKDASIENTLRCQHNFRNRATNLGVDTKRDFFNWSLGGAWGLPLSSQFQALDFC